MEILFLTEARDELLAQLRFYEEIHNRLARRFAGEIEGALVMIQSFPDVGAPFEAGTRRLMLKQFPISLVYRHLPDQIVIIAVPHHAQRPGYWKGR